MIKKLAFIAALLIVLLLPLTVSALERYSVIILGDQDEYVLKLQKELYARGYLKTKPTGYFGAETQRALARYQERNGLKADGKAGEDTLKKIYGKNYEPLPSTRQVKEDPKQSSDSFESIRPGDTGSDVQDIQQKLKVLGYYTYSKITSYYGPETETAVRAFQKNNNLKADGVVGEKTYETIFDDTAVEAFTESTPDEPETETETVQSAGVAQVAYEAEQVIALGSDKANLLIEFGKRLLGKRYRSGAEGPNTFDCSGFVYYCLRSMGIKRPPRSSSDQSRYEPWTKISNKADLSTGDIVFFKTRGHPNGVGHSGIYIGGGKFIHSSTGKGVIISDLSAGYYASHYQWARRVF